MSGGDDYLEDLVGVQSWSGQTDSVTIEHFWLDENGDPISNEVVFADGLETVTVSNHGDDFYNGVYYKVEDWGGYPHWAKEDRSAHLFYLASGSGYW